MFENMFKTKVLKDSGILEKIIPIHDLSER
jgi:hypothetical protein